MRKKRTVKHEHVVVDFTGPVVMRCNHCRRTAPFPGECEVAYAVGCIELFQDIHKDCALEVLTLDKIKPRRMME